jgi:hypothetical protein
MLVLVETDRICRFVKGLCLEPKRTLIGIDPESFSTGVEIASRIEGEDIEQAKRKGKEGQKSSTQKRYGQPQWQRNKYPRQREMTNTRNSIICYQCGKRGHGAVFSKQAAYPTSVMFPMWRRWI